MEIEQTLLPRNNSGLSGHEAAEITFNLDKVHHAWMVTGPKGVGKATLAYKMARFLLSNAPTNVKNTALFGNVLEKKAITTLNTNLESQPNCLISAGSNPDLMVVEKSEDPKTGKMRNNILVEDIRKINSFFHKVSDKIIIYKL